MRTTAILHVTKRIPLIKFLGKRQPPKALDHTPHPHPASPTHNLPNSFASYRSNAQQHGPLGGNSPLSSSGPSASAHSSQLPSSSPSAAAATYPYGAIGGHSGTQLGSILPKKGEAFDRSDLPARFRKTSWTEAEIEAIETGGASLLG